MLPLIATALRFVQFAPLLASLFVAKEPTIEAAKKVVEIATGVTGALTGDEAAQILETDKSKLVEFKWQIMENMHELDKLQFADVADARKRDIEFLQNGHVNKRASIMLGAVFIMLLLGLSAVVFMSSLDEFAKTILNLLIGRLLGYVDQAFNFEFGTTRTSKDKDATINKLSDK